MKGKKLEHIQVEAQTRTIQKIDKRAVGCSEIS